MSKHQPGTDDDTFRRAIGWQSPEAPLPDDYEEQLLERLFSDGVPQLGDVSLHGFDELGPVSAAPLSLVPAVREEAREAVSPPPLVDTPPVSPKLSWRPSRRMTMMLAAAAAVALVGLHQLPAADPAATPVAAPTPRSQPVPPAPDEVTPLVPDEALSSCEGDDADAPCNDDGHPAKPAPSETPRLDEATPDPGARRLARRDSRREATPGPEADVTAPADVVASVDEIPRGVLPRRAAQYGDAQLVALGGAPAVAAPTWGWDDCGMGDCSLTAIGPTSVRGFDPNAGHAEVAAALLDDDMPLPAVAVDEPAVRPAVLRTPGIPARPVAHLATHEIGPRWLGLDVSLPRDIENTPAGIRVVGAIDISKTHRQLQF